MEKHGSEDKRKTLAQKTYGDFKPSPIPIAPDGGIAPGYATPAPSQEPEETICEQGPCQYYWQITCGAGEGNTEGTWEHLGISRPVAHVTTCTAHPGTETELSRDEPIYTCSKWDPANPGGLIRLEKRRKAYLARHVRLPRWRRILRWLYLGPLWQSRLPMSEDPKEDPDSAIHTEEEN